jgi:hypothetical protein
MLYITLRFQKVHMHRLCLNIHCCTSIYSLLKLLLCQQCNRHCVASVSIPRIPHTIYSAIVALSVNFTLQ